MKGNLEENAVRVHDLIPHEYELSTIWDTLIKAFECGYARGHLATLEGKYRERGPKE